MDIMEKMVQLVELVGEAGKAYHGDFFSDKGKSDFEDYQTMFVAAYAAGREAEKEIKYPEQDLPDEFMAMVKEVKRLEEKKTFYESLRMAVHNVGRDPWQHGIGASTWNHLFGPLSPKAEILSAQATVSDTLSDTWGELEKAKRRVANRSRKGSKVAGARLRNGQEYTRLRMQKSKEVRDRMLSLPEAVEMETRSKKAEEEAAALKEATMLDIRDRMAVLLDTEVDGD